MAGPGMHNRKPAREGDAEDSMRLRRAQVIWISSGGEGKITRFSVNPLLLTLFMLLLFMCVLSIPFLEESIFALRSRIAHLEHETSGLKGEIATLLCFKEAVAQIQENESVLRSHYGLEKVRSLEKTSGLGGETLPFKSRGKTQSGGEKPSEGETSLLAGVREKLEGKMRTLVSNHESLSRLKIKQGELWESTPSIAPLDLENPRISSPFGFRKNPFTQKKEFHAGVDLVGPAGTKVIAPAKGKVVNTGHDPWMGNYLVLQHPAGFKTIYGHLSGVCVRQGSEVKRGDPIGYVGNTGLSTSAHLHYGVTKGERVVDPMQFILDRKG